MSDVRTALLESLRAQDRATQRERLASAIGDLDLAEARLEVKNDPGSADALARVLGRMLLDDATPVDLIETAKAAAQRAPRDGAGQSVALLTGSIIWGATGQAPSAEPYFRRVRRADPANPEVLAFYRDLFGEPAEAKQLIQVLVQARRAATDPQMRFELAAEVAEIAEQRLTSADRAIEMWRAVVREDGYDRRAIAALTRLYRDGGKWTALVDLLKDELDRIGVSPEATESRIATLLEIANLYRDRLQLSTMALATLQRILEIDPQHEASLDALAETYAAANRWSDLLSVYARRVAACKAAGDIDRQVDLLRRVAQIWVEKLGNPQRALEPLAEVLAIAPKDQKARALVAKIHEQRRDFRALIALRREELVGLEGEAALALRIELARLAEDRLGDRREAIVAWNEVLAQHGDGDVALAALSRIYERESRWSSAAEILHRRLARSDLAEALPLLNHLGGLYSDRLHSQVDAVLVWSELLRLSPGHDKATRRLRDAYVGERRWDDLTALYEAQDRLLDVVEVLHSAADRIGDVEERVALYRRVASLCQRRLGQPERALKALERTLAIQPDNLEVARELLPIYREQKNWARLMSTYEVLLRAAQDDDERLEIIAAMQAVAQDKLASPALTLQWAAAAFRIRPTDVGLAERLEGAAERADGWDEVTTIYEERIGAHGVTPEERLGLLGKLASIARDRLFKPDDAQRYFRRVLALDPHNTTAVSALEEIYSSTRRWEDLSEVIGKRLEVTTEPDARLRILRRLAKLQEDHLSDLDSAVRSYSALLDLSPEDSDALTSLARIHRNRGNWSDLAVALERTLSLCHSPTERVPVLFELADIRASRLQDSERAVTGFLTVLDIDPLHGRAVDALESLRQADPSMSLPIMRGLLPYYRRVESLPKEAEAMEVIVAAESDSDQRQVLLDQLAVTCEKMPDRRLDALRIRNELFRGHPERWQGRQILQRLGSELDRMGDVASAYEAVLGDMSLETLAAEAEGHTLPRERVALRRDLLLEYAAILRDTLGRLTDAERAYRDILYMDETHQGAYEALEALLRGRQANEDLVALYRRRVDVTFNPGEQNELLSRIIGLCRHVLGDRGTAVATAEELLDLIPDDLPTISLLVEMYAEGGEEADFVKLEALLGRQAELTDDDPAESRVLRVRRASLRMQRLGDAFGAVDLLGQVLGEDPDHGEARALLETLLGVPGVALQACAVLDPIYARVGDHEGRIRVLKVRRAHAERTGAIDEAVGYLLQIAALRERDLSSPSEGFDAVREAYLIDPTRFDTREEVERLGLALHRALELAEVWRTALNDPKVLEPTLRIDLTTRLARLLDQQLRDQEGARQAYTALLDLDPADATLAHEAVSALCRLHLEAGDEVAFVGAKRRLLGFIDTVAEQVRTRIEIAETEGELGDRVGSALTYSEVLDLDPANPVALEALERLFVEEQEWARLVEVLEHRILHTSDPRQKASIWRRIGEMQRDRQADLHRAIDAFQSVLDLKVGREDTAYALTALVALHEELERWPDVEEGLRRLTVIAESDRDRVELLTRTAVVVGRKLSRGHDALDLLKRVLDLAPTDPRARREVASYLDGDDTRERSVKILTPLYEAEQNWPALLEIEELQARKQPSGRRRLQALLKVARTQEERIGDSHKAFGVLCEAMTEAADQPELEEILGKVERLGASPERSEALVAAYGKTVEHILDSALQQRVLRERGRVALERLGQLDIARQAYERVLELSPDDKGAADALEQIYLRQDAFEPLALLLVGRADRASERTLRDDYLIRAAEFYRLNLDRAEEAIRVYERLSAEGLERPAVQAVIEPLYEATARWRELAGHLNRKLARLVGPAAVEVHLRLGRLYGQQLDDAETGIRHLSAAIKLDPDQAVANAELDRYLEDETMRIRVAEMLEPVFTAVGDWRRLISLQEARLADARDDQARGKLLLRIAQIEEEQLEDLERAMQSYERLFKEQPRNRYVRDQLARLSGVLGQTERYASLLTEFVDSAGAREDTDEMLAVVREAADLWSGVLRKPAQAVPLLQRILHANPDDPTVFVGLESAMTRAELWSELIAAYWREADGALSEERQIELLRKIATVATEMLDDSTEAARAYQRMIDLRPEYEIARSRLEKIYTESHRHADLLELLRERLTRTDGLEARGEVSLRIAAIQDESLGDPEGAVDTIEGMLGEQLDHPQAVAMLEAIAQKRREHRPRIVATLRPIYERTGSLQRIIEIDEWQLTHTEEPAARHELLWEIAELQSRLGDPPDAPFRTLARALAEPGPDEALDRLDREVERIATAFGVRGALGDALASAAYAEALAGDEDRRLDLLVRAAAIKHELGDPATAADILRSALQVRPSHPPALGLLDTALTRLGYHDELASILPRRADVAETDELRVEHLRRLAVLLEEVLVRPADAERAWKALLDVEPNDRQALRRLSKVYEESGSTGELVAVLERRIAASADDAERRDLRMHLASLQRETLKDRAAEIDTLRALLSEAPSDDDALAALGRALRAESRYAEAAEVVQEQATLATTDDRRATLMLEAARLYSGPLSDVTGAMERYEQVLNLQPGQEGAIGDLVTLAQQPEGFEGAGMLVMGPLEQLGRYAELAEVLAARARLSVDPEEKEDALRRLARLKVERLDDQPGALSAYIQLLDVIDEDDLPQVLDQSGRIAVGLGRGAEHLDLLAERANRNSVSGGTRVAIALYAARLAEEVLGETQRALEVLVPLVEAGLATAMVCDRVERLARSAGDAQAMELALRELARLAGEPGVQSRTMIRLGQVQLAQGRMDAAMESFRDAFQSTHDRAALQGLEVVLERSGEHPPVALLDALENAYQATGNEKGLARITAHRLAIADEADRPRLLEQLATVCDEGGGTPEQALEAWGELLAYDPESTTALGRVIDLGRMALDRLPRSVALMHKAIERARREGLRPTTLSLQAASLMLRDLGDAHGAHRTIQPVLADEPDHPEALELMIEISRGAGEFMALHQSLLRSAQVQTSQEGAVALWAEAASVAEGPLQDAELAIADLEALLSVDEHDPNAWRKLIALLRATGNYRKLAESLGRRAVLTEEPTERRDLRYRLANLFLDKLERPDDAIAVYQDMLADNANDPDAARELETLLRRFERWQDVRDVLERKRDLVPPQGRLAVQLELAQLAEVRLRDPAGALTRYREILLEHPGEPTAEAAVERLFRVSERWSDLADLFENRAERLRQASDLDGYRRATSALAALLAERLDHPERAKAILDDLLADDPTYVPALLAKASVYEAIGEQGAVALTLQRAAELDPQGPEGALLHLRLAKSTRSDSDRRKYHLEKALQLDPSNGAAATELLALGREHEQWDQVAYMLELVAARSDDPEERRNLTLERIDVMLTLLRDAEGALRILAPLYKQVQEDIEVNRRIADALFLADRVDEAAGMYNWLVEVGRRAKRNKSLSHYLTRLARISLRHQDPAGAKERLLEAYRVDTTNVETLMTLGGLHEHHGEWRDALKIYRTMLLQNADQSGLMRRGDIYLNLARAHLALDEKPSARAMLRRGLEEDTDHPQLMEELSALEE